MAEPNNTPRPSSPAAAADEETAPLLSTGANNDCVPENGDIRSHYVQNPRYIKVLTYISLLSGIVMGAFILGVVVVLVFDQYSHAYWYIRDAIPLLSFYVRHAILNIQLFLFPFPLLSRMIVQATSMYFT